MNHPTLTQHFINTAAGCPVNEYVYDTIEGMSLPKIRSLGSAYRAGWLFNVLARITPLTCAQHEDYVNMARLFITNGELASAVLTKMARDLTVFSVAAGVTDRSPVLQAHTKLYNDIASAMETQFGITAPQPFASVTIDENTQNNILEFRPFVKAFLARAS